MCRWLRQAVAIFVAVLAMPAVAGTPAAIGSMFVYSSPPTFDFGTVPVGGSRALSIGAGAAAANANGVQVTSVTLPGPDFTFSSGCGAVMGPNTSCPLTGTFAPTSPGAKSATLAITCVTILAPLVATTSFLCNGTAFNVTLLGNGIVAQLVPALDPNLTAALAMGILLLGIGHLWRRRRLQRG